MNNEIGYVTIFDAQVVWDTVKMDVEGDDNFHAMLLNRDTGNYAMINKDGTVDVFANCDEDYSKPLKDFNRSELD
mgnify:CR=1 FL=1